MQPVPERLPSKGAKNTTLTLSVGERSIDASALPVNGAARVAASVTCCGAYTAEVCRCLEAA